MYREPKDTGGEFLRLWVAAIVLAACAWLFWLQQSNAQAHCPPGHRAVAVRSLWRTYDFICSPEVGR